MKTIQVMIVDDHALFRQGVTTVINQEPDIHVVAEASNGSEALDQYSTLKPDVSLIDLVMPGQGGIDVIRDLCHIDPRAKIIVLSTYDTHEDIEKALSAGARGYLLKDVLAHDLIEAIRAVHSGRTRVAPTVAAKLADRYEHVRLTMRELEILRLVAEGKANKEISDTLHVSGDTVKTHITSLLGKLGAANRTEATIIGIRRGLVRVPS
jgi:two-component system NarL family response regulator